MGVMQQSTYNFVSTRSLVLTEAERFGRFQQERVRHWEMVSAAMQRRKGWGTYYHRRLGEIYRFLVPRHSKVLEVGCGQGDLLQELEPSYGVGVDFSPQMIATARARHPHLAFLVQDAHTLTVEGKFDFVVLSDLLNDVWDVQQVLGQLRTVCTPSTRVLINSYSRLWELPLRAAEKLGLAYPNLNQNWLTLPDLKNLLTLAGFEGIQSWHEILYPLPTPFLSAFMNRFAAKLFPLNHLALCNFLVARPRPAPYSVQPTVSIIVPARNESGNIQAIFERVPEFARETELVFVEGHSRDNTYETIQREIAAHPERNALLLRQIGKGKGDAVRLGFERARGEILMILDADLTMPPEDLPRFYTALVNGTGELINGVRLVYPMEKEAMRFVNLLGNKLFSIMFSWLLGQPVKDTLCGTKVVWATHYRRIAENRMYFGDFDPFGDFDLLFGAAKLNLKLVDMPIRYRERTYGTTNIQRWRHGWLLLNMVAFAARRLKFV